MSQCISMHLAVFVKAQVATLMMAWFRHWVPDSDSAVPLGPKIYDVGVGTVWILRVLPMTVKAASWCHVNSDYKRCKLWCSVIFSGFCFHPFSLVVKSWVFQGRHNLQSRPRPQPIRPAGIETRQASWCQLQAWEKQNMQYLSTYPMSGYLTASPASFHLKHEDIWWNCMELLESFYRCVKN